MRFQILSYMSKTNFSLAFMDGKIIYQARSFRIWLRDNHVIFFVHARLKNQFDIYGNVLKL